jgi:hypothetical protein
MADPDLRHDKMESSEGRGIARGRFLRWWHEFPPDFRRAFGYEDGSAGIEVDDEDLGQDFPPDELRSELSDAAGEESDLIGFWVSWHRAGGFHGLELAGWNRATIYRKLKRFRMKFDSHPDEFRVPWIALDLDTCWMNDLGFELDSQTDSWRLSR